MGISIEPSRGAGPALALLLVLTALAGPAVGGAAAQDSGSYSECSTDDAVVGGILQSLGSLFQPQPDYGVSGQTKECLQQIEEERAEVNATQTNLYESSLALGDATDGVLTTTGNQLQNVRAQAWSDAELDMIRAYNNNETKSSVIAEGDAAIEDRYAVIERNLLTGYNRTMNHFAYLETAKNNQDTTAIYEISQDNYAYQVLDIGDRTYSYQMVNGAKFNVLTAAYEGSETTYNNPRLVLETASSSSWYNGPTKHVGDARVVSYSPTGQSTVVVDADAFDARLDTIQTDVQTLKSENVEPFADNLFANFSRGELDVTDVWGATRLANEAGTDLNSTGANQFAATQLASLGYATDLSAAFNLETSTGATYQGSLLYEGNDLSGWETGQLYNPSELNGTVVMAVQNGSNSGFKEINSPFTLQEMYNTKTGEEVQNTTIQKTVYKTDTGNLSQQIDRLIDSQRRYQNMSAQAYVPPEDSGSDDLPPWAIGAGAAGLAVGALGIYARNSGGGGRRGAA